MDGDFYGVSNSPSSVSKCVLVERGGLGGLRFWLGCANKFSRPNGMAVYESREVFYGPAASLLKLLYASSLQKSFEAQGQGLKLYLEKK